MRFIKQFLALLSGAASLALADTPNPQYQKPTIVKYINESTISNQCGQSSFKLLHTGDILVEDCTSMMNAWGEKGNFTTEMSSWTNSTGLDDHFYIFATYRSCQFALKRTDGLNNTVLIGNTDFNDVAQFAMELGNYTWAQAVEGAMPCNTNEANTATIEWSLRETGRND